MRVALMVCAAIALGISLGACAPYPQPRPAPPPQVGIADPVGLIAAEPPAPTTAFPGLLTLAGYGLAAGGTAIDTVLMGGAEEP